MTEPPKKVRAGITGIGSAVPDRVVTNAEWAGLVDTSDEWIRSRTGISERRFCDAQTAASDLAFLAAQRALARAGTAPQEIELIIVATTTPDYPVFPSTAALLQERLGCAQAGGFDLSAACSGFGYAFYTAAQFIENGEFKKILLVAVDTLSKNMDHTDRNVCVLFGDGAGAMVMEPAAAGYGHLASVLGLRGSGAEELIVRHGGSRAPLTPENIASKDRYISMNGKSVFKFAVSIMGEATEQVLKKAGLKPEDIDIFVPHQANIRIIDAALKHLKLAPDKALVNIQKYGNTSSASIPLALDEAYQAGKLKKGMLVAACGFGAGLTWAANLFRWGY
ncbi:MAG: ketoacyl-ACP synthase III [Candidatus Margulisbacteria bacterium]|nr:ketoacyl-ACP synthase III [Candidatus Margulisiibacteriota bacterium]